MTKSTMWLNWTAASTSSSSHSPALSRAPRPGAGRWCETSSPLCASVIGRLLGPDPPAHQKRRTLSVPGVPRHLHDILYRGEVLGVVGSSVGLAAPGPEKPAGS